MTPRRVVPIIVALLLGAVVSACGGGDSAGSSSRSTASSTTKAVDPEADSTASTVDSPFGGGHKPPIAQVEDIAKGGAGPMVGDVWTAALGVNVCGRFLDPLVGPESGGVTPNPNGTITIAPTAEADAGLGATLEKYVKSVGIALNTGELRMPRNMVPSKIELGESTIEVAGQTLEDGFDCDGVAASVEAWVYSPEAVQTGKGLVTVVKNPQDIPFVADGMAVVITLMPDSSLPTLPPSASALR